MNSGSNWVVLGRFGRPYGIKGFVTVHSFTEPRDNLLSYTDWYVFLNQRWQALKLLEVQPQLKAIIARVQGFDSRATAACLTNAEIAVQGSQLPVLEFGEYYWHELVGMQVVNQQGEPLGLVAELMSTGSNDVLVVQGNKRHLIPYLLGDFVLEINKEKQIICVDWDPDF